MMKCMFLEMFTSYYAVVCVSRKSISYEATLCIVGCTQELWEQLPILE